MNHEPAHGLNHNRTKQLWTHFEPTWNNPTPNKMKFVFSASFQSIGSRIKQKFDQGFGISIPIVQEYY